MKIIIGTRGSKLSLVQTRIVRDKLLVINSKITIDIKIISTKGDRDKKSPIPLDTIGKGWFTKELDNELLLGNIDLAVHSLKDLPEILPEGLVIAGILEREDPRDVLVSKEHKTLENLKQRAIIGTDSNRRKTQILYKRKDFIIQSLRGNVDGRLKKLENGEYDAILLAAAGLHRLGLQSNITQYFDATDVIPSPGQGALAVVVKKDKEHLCKIIEKLNHTPTVIATQAERAFSQAVGGGCKTPTGAYAICTNNSITLYGMIGSLDGAHIVKESIKGKSLDGKQLGITLAKRLLEISKNL